MDGREISAEDLDAYCKLQDNIEHIKEQRTHWISEHPGQYAAVVDGGSRTLFAPDKAAILELVRTLPPNSVVTLYSVPASAV